MSIERKDLISSNVESAGYDNDKQVLEVEFKGNRIYKYYQVSKDLAESFLNADSHGSFMNQVIKPKVRNENIECERVQ